MVSRIGTSSCDLLNDKITDDVYKRKKSTRLNKKNAPVGVSYRGIDSDKPSVLGSKIDMPAKSIDSTGVQHPGNQINPGGSGRTRRPVCI